VAVAVMMVVMLVDFASAVQRLMLVMTATLCRRGARQNHQREKCKQRNDRRFG
jgi:hypothetical protein